MVVVGREERGVWQTSETGCPHTESDCPLNSFTEHFVQVTPHSSTLNNSFCKDITAEHNSKHPAHHAVAVLIFDSTHSHCQHCTLGQAVEIYMWKFLKVDKYYMLIFDLKMFIPFVNGVKLQKFWLGTNWKRFNAYFVWKSWRGVWEGWFWSLAI